MVFEFPRLIRVTLATCVFLASLGVDAFERRGMVLGLYASDPSFDYSFSLDEIAACGASSVLLLVPIDQNDVASAEVAPIADWRLRQLSGVMTQATRRGLEPAVIPIVSLSRLAPGKWRGTLAPPDWSHWFSIYTRELSRLAEVAQSGRAGLFSVGSELCSSEVHDGHWRQVIRAVRERFSGALTYSSNWDHLPAGQFLEDLDYLGLNAYYELVCDGQDSTIPTLIEAWHGIRAEIVAPWAASAGKPFMFLEVGYPSVAGADRYPWNYTASGERDVAVQERLYYAFARAWEGEPALAGVFFYVWWEGPERDPTGYTPRGKPAGEVVRSWYTNMTRTPSDP